MSAVSLFSFFCRFGVVMIGIVAGTFAIPSIAFAETTMYLSPVFANVEVGAELRLGVFVDSGDIALNAAEGALRYDPGKFRFVRVETDASILNSWTLAPTNDTSLALVKFAGISSTPYSGARGPVASVVFEAIAPGEGEFVFDSAAAIHAADGSGANVLTRLGRAAFSVVPSGGEIAGIAAVSALEQTDEGEVAGAVIEATDRTIASETHPDPERWYVATSSLLSWKLADDTVEVRMGLSDDPDGSASVRYTPPVGNKTLTDLDQGISYFHLMRITQDGSGTIEHYPLRIDSFPPTQFSVELVDRNDPTDPNIVFFIVATDTVSGINRVEFALDGGTGAPWVDDGTHRYTITGLPIGTHKLVGRAFDRAGNVSSIEIEFELEGIDAPSLLLPKSEWKEGEVISVSGTALPESTITLSLVNGTETLSSAEVVAGADGAFSWEDSSPLEPGAFLVSAIASDARGARSEPSQPLEFTVVPSMLGVLARHPLIPTGIGLLILLASVGGWYWIRRERSEDDLEDDEGVEDEEQLSAAHSSSASARSMKIAAVNEPPRTKNATDGFVVTLGSRKGGSIRREAR